MGTGLCDLTLTQQVHVIHRRGAVILLIHPRAAAKTRHHTVSRPCCCQSLRGGLTLVGTALRVRERSRKAHPEQKCTVIHRVTCLYVV